MWLARALLHALLLLMQLILQLIWALCFSFRCETRAVAEEERGGGAGVLFRIASRSTAAEQIEEGRGG